MASPDQPGSTARMELSGSVRLRRGFTTTNVSGSRIRRDRNAATSKGTPTAAIAAATTRSSGPSPSPSSTRDTGNKTAMPTMPAAATTAPTRSAADTRHTLRGPTLSATPSPI
jgi:hypothetical protein